MREPPVQNFWDRLNNLVLIRFLLLFACGWALVQLLAYFETVIVVFTLAAIVAFSLSYPVQWLHRFLPHGIAVTLVFLLSLVIMTGLTVTVGLAIVSQAQQLIDSITGFSNSLLPLLERLEEYLRNRNVRVNIGAIQEQFQNQFLTGIGVGIGYSLATIQIFFGNFLNFVLIAVVAFFMLLDGERLWNLIIKFLPKHVRGRFTGVVKRKLLGFVRGQLILTLFLTISTSVVFLVLQVPFPLLLAVIVGVFDIIPGIGATLGISIICLIVLFQGGWLTLKVLAICIVLQQIQDNIIVPRVMRDSLNINPVVVFFALLVGAKVAGLLGVFIAIPMASVIVSMFEIEEMKAEP